MVEIKTLDGGLNTDVSDYRLPKGDYKDALNISKDAVEGSQDNVITPLLANRGGDEDFVYPAGRGRSLGAYGNDLRNTIIWMRWNINRYHQVLEFDATTRTQTTIFTNLTDSDDVDILGFTENGLITSINIYNRDEGDLLYFVDSLGRPTFMDITKMKNGDYTPVTRDIIDACTVPPLSPPTYVYNNDTTRRVNYFRNLFVRVRYRWVLDDNTKTTYSPISQIVIPTGILDYETTNNGNNNNNVSISITTGAKNVKGIEIAASFAQKTNVWSDFQTIVSLDKDKLSIADDDFYTYNFYNDSTYPYIDIRESVQLFDYLPDEALCQELVNGNVLAYGGITEGYDNDLVPNVVTEVSEYAVANVQGGSLTGVLVQSSVLLSRYFITFNGIPAVGSVVLVTARRISDSMTVTIGTYTTIVNDNSNTVASNLGDNMEDTGLAVLVHPQSNLLIFTLSISAYDTVTLTITPPSTSALINSLPVWKWSSQMAYGLVYFDKKGKTNGVVYSEKLTFPYYSEDVGGDVNGPVIETSIYHRPFDWAYSYQFVFTKDFTQYLFWCTNSVNISEANYIYLEVTGLIFNAEKFPTTAQVLSYSFQDGDRIRLIKDLETGFYYDDSYDTQVLGLLDAPNINNTGAQTGKQFLKINKTDPFNDALFTPNLQKYIIEIYRPVQQTSNDANQTFFECGQQYAILNPETEERVHAGMLQDQSEDLTTPATFEFKQGDSYFRIRSIALTETSTASFAVMDRNVVDTYISAVNSFDGRPNVIDVNARRAFYGAMIRHGQAYQPNTNINGLNRFYYEDFLDLDASFGNIMRMKVRDKFVRPFQQLKIGMIPIYNQISKDANGDEILVRTDKLLNPVQYYSGNFGIGNHPESLSSNNFADYGCDDIHGVIWRASTDGITVLSILYKVNSWANANIPLRKTSHKIYGAFDQKLSNYIAALEVIQCVTPEVASFILSDAMVGIEFSQTVSVTGNTPFVLSNVTKPSWMTISVSDETYLITFSGTPESGDEGTGVAVSFTISNGCGSENISKTITVEAEACIPVAIIGLPVLPDGNTGVPYSYSFDLQGTEPFSLSGITKPSWMNIAVFGSSVIFSGTPDASGSAIIVSFTINNCSSDTDSFDDLIDVSPDNYFLYNTNNNPALNFFVKIGNENDPATETIYSGLYSSDPVSGSDLVNLPAVGANVVLFVTGKTILSATCNGDKGHLAGSYATWSGINGALLQIVFRTN